MNKEMIISSGDYETRVAILEDDQVVEVFIEREKQRGVVGNVYKGRVNKILPGMQSSFIDIGLERDAFLYVSEVVNTVEEFERLAGDDEDEPVVALGTPPPEAGAGSVEAAETGGQVIMPNELEGLPELLPNRAVTTVNPLHERIWDTPLAFLVVLVLLTVEWIGRKVIRLA
jgi:ribonuclease G